MDSAYCSKRNGSVCSAICTQESSKYHYLNPNKTFTLDCIGQTLSTLNLISRGWTTAFAHIILHLDIHRTCPYSSSRTTKLVHRVHSLVSLLLYPVWYWRNFAMNQSRALLSSGESIDETKNIIQFRADCRISSGVFLSKKQWNFLLNKLNATLNGKVEKFRRADSIHSYNNSKV